MSKEVEKNWGVLPSYGANVKLVRIIKVTAKTTVYVERLRYRDNQFSRECRAMTIPLARFANEADAKTAIENYQEQDKVWGERLMSVMEEAVLIRRDREKAAEDHWASFSCAQKRKA